MDCWEISFLLRWPIFRCYVSFREGHILCISFFVRWVSLVIPSYRLDFLCETFPNGFPPKKQAHKGESPKHQHPVSVKPLAEETNSINTKYIHSDMSKIKNRISQSNNSAEITRLMWQTAWYISEKKQTLPASLLQRRFSRVMLSKRREFHLRILEFLVDHFFWPRFSTERLHQFVGKFSWYDIFKNWSHL